MTNSSDIPLVGVIGGGSFGTAVANLLAENNRVLLYARRQEVVDNFNVKRLNMRQKVHENITAISNLQEIAERCTLIFPMIPSANFASMLEDIAPSLRPDHILIHGTKGFNIKLGPGEDLLKAKQLRREQVQTISELIADRTVVVRIGCVSGPNLAAELAAHKPAGTVIASKFDEVIKTGIVALKSPRLQVFGSHDLIGVELSGVLKNVIAIASGALSGMDLGENARALLISKGLAELIRIGTTLGGDLQAFLGLAGIGDIIASASSSSSRNYTVGYRLSQGESLQQILDTSEEVAEGINTVRTAKLLADHYRVRVPIIQMLYRALFQDMPTREGLEYLMRYPFEQDVDFL